MSPRKKGKPALYHSPVKAQGTPPTPTVSHSRLDLLNYLCPCAASEHLKRCPDLSDTSVFAALTVRAEVVAYIKLCHTTACHFKVRTEASTRGFCSGQCGTQSATRFNMTEEVRELRRAVLCVCSPCSVHGVGVCVR
ncbi:hypothetical protein J6590_061932 [Homalodisca vitripennis]|nr:hypothetical protein J6590_061932 [Homalodisca vitripennis]